MEEYKYMVKICANGKPSLVRVGDDYVFRKYDPREPGKWHESKFLDAFAWGGSDWIDYDDCTEEEATEYMKEIDDFWKRVEAEEATK